MSGVGDEKALEVVLARARIDREFRQRLLDDPHAALADIGVLLRADLKIKFVEKGPELDVLIVLPDLASTSQELSREELDVITGGAHYPWGDPTR